MKTKNACPFCGYHTTTVLSPASKPNTSTHSKGYQIECVNCGARGPCGMKGPNDAAGVWDQGDFDNRRPFIEEPRPEHATASIVDFKSHDEKRTERLERIRTAANSGMDPEEESYWKTAGEDRDFVFWAEVEGAYRRACNKTEVGSFQVDQWVFMAEAIKDAIERYHGRAGGLLPKEIKSLVEDIQELNR